jgi:ketosteroid isomerase-like protein
MRDHSAAVTSFPEIPGRTHFWNERAYNDLTVRSLRFLARTQRSTYDGDRSRRREVTANVAADGVDAFQRYVRAFQSLDADAILPFYDEPCLLISPQGSVPLLTHADVKRFFQDLMADLRKQGYGSSEFPQLRGTLLSQTLTLVSGTGVWRKTGGEELRRFGLTYLLRRTDHSWRIAVAAIHDPTSS